MFFKLKVDLVRPSRTMIFEGIFRLLKILIDRNGCNLIKLAECK